MCIKVPLNGDSSVVPTYVRDIVEFRWNARNVDKSLINRYVTHFPTAENGMFYTIFWEEWRTYVLEFDSTV
jgi:hypothetical protein